MNIKKLQENKMRYKLPFKPSSHMFQDFIHFLKKSRPETDNPDDFDIRKIKIVKLFDLKDVFPTKFKEELYSILKEK